VKVDSFQELAADFDARVRRIVWCTVATVDNHGRPRSRILHPLWEGQVGWIATGRNSPKTAHLDNNRYVSLSYWDQEHEQIYAECRATWVDDNREKARIWDRFGAEPEPYGYDLSGFFPAKDSPDYGLLRLDPWRVELWSLNEMISGKPTRIWMS
jgi:general stress protein 26